MHGPHPPADVGLLPDAGKPGLLSAAGETGGGKPGPRSARGETGGGKPGLLSAAGEPGGGKPGLLSAAGEPDTGKPDHVRAGRAGRYRDEAGEGSAYRHEIYLYHEWISAGGAFVSVFILFRFGCKGDDVCKYRQYHTLCG